jgi:hypothetical protein
MSVQFVKPQRREERQENLLNLCALSVFRGKGFLSSNFKKALNQRIWVIEKYRKMQFNPGIGM